jgi:geranylgeranyl pyrophosphate synthase
MEKMRAEIDNIISRDIDDITDKEFAKITRYALNGGKRLRPLIISSLSGSVQEAASMSLFVEYVHAASLIIDDMPFMDNDNYRRGAVTTHTTFGVDKAQLASFNLVVIGVCHINQGIIDIRTHYNNEDYLYLKKKINQEFKDNLGYKGLCGGQMTDLALAKDSYEIDNLPPRQQQATILQMIKTKTGCLFALSFLLGWVVRGGRVDCLDTLRETGYAFGDCYQIIDDLRDREKDRESNGGKNNICRYFSHNELIELFNYKLQIIHTCLTNYDLWSPIMTELYLYLEKSFIEIFQKSSS